MSKQKTFIPPETEFWPANSCCIHRQGDFGPNFSLDGFFFRGLNLKRPLEDARTIAAAASHWIIH